MGGSGSGFWYRWDSKSTVEATRRINVNWLRRKGFLERGCWFPLSWTRNGSEPSGWIQGRVNDLCEVVTWVYRYRRNEGEWEDVQLPTHLEWTSCRFGGQRPWFRCPNRRCWRRVAILYGAGKYFLCRRCAGVVYESQRERWAMRCISKAQKIREKLGGSPGLGDPFPEKPKWMRWRTYERLRRRAMGAENDADRALFAMIRRDLSRS